MKKLGITLIAIAALSFGYLYFCGCCPETCCKTATECQKSDTAETPLYKVETNKTG